MTGAMARTLPGRAESVVAIAAAELRGALRARVMQAFGLLFALLALCIALAGLGASGEILVQGYTRTGVSMLMLALYLLPLVGLVAGAGAFGAEHGGVELLLTQPVSRTTVIAGRVLGLAAALAGVGISGFGLAGIVVGIATGTGGLGGYLLVAGGCMAVGFAGLALGTLIGVLVRRRSTAIGAALAVWFAVAVLYDFAAIGILQFTGDGEPGPMLVALLALNPIDGVRVLALTRLGADVLLGPTGASVERVLGSGGGAAFILAMLVLACALPLLLGRLLYRRRDF
jgi:Cu-processing system permease protein